MNTKYEKYRALLSKVADIAYAGAVLSWDQEVMMPPKGGGFRAQQLATLAGISHELSTSEELGKLLNELNNDAALSEKEKRNVKRSLKDYTDRKKFTTEFVETMNRSVSEAFQAWQTAKGESNFKLFAPSLEKLVELKRKECEMYGYKDHPYDALIDQYEPGTTTKDIETLFIEVRKQLVPFIKQIAGAKQSDNSFLHKYYDKDKQWQYGLDVLKQMGYDFDAGRQDISAHPFTVGFSMQDVRVTTRIDENNFSEMLWSCIHEGGHALYEQGLLPENYGLPAGEPISLGIHESQSRLWENNVGRCLPFWEGHYAKLQSIFPENLKNVPVSSFYKAINQVKPSLIRTNADELTYHSHIMIRFEVEKALIEGSINVKDLPEYWNSKYKEYLGIDVTDDAHGVLQDVHWSHAGFGYFPTYSLGSFYAAQFYAQAKKDIPNLESEIEKGNTQALLTWLRDKVHRHGKYYTAEELCINITGEKLNFNYFMEYARKKYSGIYELAAVGMES
jgi:carboxypeptidase Taq